MALAFAPHTVQVKSFDQKRGGRKVANEITFAPTYTLQVSISAKDQTEAFNATGVDLKRPHKMMLDIDDVGKVKAQDRVTWGARLFAVMTPPKVSNHGLPTDHASVMLDEIYD